MPKTSSAIHATGRLCNQSLMLVSFSTTLERYLPAQVEAVAEIAHWRWSPARQSTKTSLGLSFGDDHSAIDALLKNLQEQRVKQSKRSTSPRALGTSPS